MNIENYIESQYRELNSISTMNLEFLDLYSYIEYQKLKEILTTLHYDFITLFKLMNERLPTQNFEQHFWADPSRQLIKIIEIALGLFNALKDTKYAFQIDEYYYDIINKCRGFLKTSGGSPIPVNMDKIELYYTIPIFRLGSTITVKNLSDEMSYELKQIGSGSYANVFKYKDAYYNTSFVVKRAKKELTPKELIRFKREFEEMRELSSPYILEVYRYNDDNNEYIMEYMDTTLFNYISTNNSNLSMKDRKMIGSQILKAFDYIHSKGRLHRDISPNNILIKKYDGIVVIKISDFGLVKIQDSSLTTVNTEFKGCFNDMSLITEGFDKYNILHETFALTRVIYFVITGKTNIYNITNLKLKNFVDKGLNSDKTQRFKNVGEMISLFREI